MSNSGDKYIDKHIAEMFDDIIVEVWDGPVRDTYVISRTEESKMSWDEFDRDRAIRLDPEWDFELYEYPDWESPDGRYFGYGREVLTRCLIHMKYCEVGPTLMTLE